MQGITPVNKHEDRLEQVVTITAPTRDVQKKIQFGRCGNIVERFHVLIITSGARMRVGHVFQRSRMMRKTVSGWGFFR